MLLYQGEFNLLSNYDKQGTIAHEMGHVMGLDHVSNGESSSIMMQLVGSGIPGRATNVPNQNDYETINFVY